MAIVEKHRLNDEYTLYIEYHLSNPDDEAPDSVKIDPYHLEGDIFYFYDRRYPDRIIAKESDFIMVSFQKV